MAADRRRCRGPDGTGHFGRYGGRFVPEALIAALDELDAAYRAAMADPRSTPSSPAAARLRRPAQPAHRARTRFAAHCRRRAGAAQARGPQPHRRAQDQQHPRPGAADPAHGQDRGSSPRPAPASTASPPPPPRPCSAWSASSTWARRTSAARRSTSSAWSCSAPGRARSTAASRTLKDAINEAMRDWVANVDDTHYIIGTVAGPAPVPGWSATSTRSSAGRPAPRSSSSTGRLPDAVVACVGGGSNAIGIFHAFLDDAGRARRRRGRRRRRRDRAARRDAHRRRARACCTARAPTSCRTSDGQTIGRTRSRAGLDYPGVGPEHAWLQDIGRASYEPVTDAEALEAFVCSAGPRASSRPWSPPTPSPVRCELGRELGPGRGDRGQPLRPRRQGRRHRRPLLRPRSTGERAPEGRPERRARGRSPPRRGRGPRGAGRLPARRGSRRRRRVAALARWSRPAST